MERSEDWTRLIGDNLPPRALVQAWTPADFSALDDVGGRRNFERGRRMFDAALCSRCHRVGAVGRAVGPDLTAAAQRFNRADLLLAILDPSRAIAENYRSQRVTTIHGKVYEGRVVYSGDYRDPNLKLAIDPFAPAKLTEIPKVEIESSADSPVSFMPAGLLNTLSRDEVLDLLAYIESAGDERSSHFGSE